MGVRGEEGPSPSLETTLSALTELADTGVGGFGDGGAGDAGGTAAGGTGLTGNDAGIARGVLGMNLLFLWP